MAILVVRLLSDSAKGRSAGTRKPNEQVIIKLISEGQVSESWYAVCVCLGVCVCMYMCVRAVVCVDIYVFVCAV